MLVNKAMFDVVEKKLIQNGKIAEFEQENGKIKGRMMITRTVIPDEIDINIIAGKTPVAFEASFDFYDCAVGLAIYTDTCKAASGIWITPQAEGAEPPTMDWIEFFIEKLLGSINDDGSYSFTIYSFVNDARHMTIIPVLRRRQR